MKKSALLLLLLSCFLCACTRETDAPAVSAETAEVYVGEPIGTSLYTCITGESDTHTTLTDDTAVSVKAFAHQIYNSEKDYMVTLTTTITASSTDSEVMLTQISGKLTDAQSDGLTVSEHISGNTGTVVLYLNQMSVCHFQYRVSPDGSFEIL